MIIPLSKFIFTITVTSFNNENVVTLHLSFCMTKVCFFYLKKVTRHMFCVLYVNESQEKEQKTMQVSLTRGSCLHHRSTECTDGLCLQ